MSASHQANLDVYGIVIDHPYLYGFGSESESTHVQAQETGWYAPELEPPGRVGPRPRANRGDFYFGIADRIQSLIGYTTRHRTLGPNAANGW